MTTIAKIIPIHPEVAELLAQQEAAITSKTERISSLEQDVLNLGRQNIALAAEAETAQLQTQQIEVQLAAADARVRELEAALVLASLPAGSRDNVIQMVREAA